VDIKAVLVELPASTDVTTTADCSVRPLAVSDSTRRLGRLGNSISGITARFNQQQQLPPAEPQQQQQQQQQQQEGRKQDSETSAL